MTGQAASQARESSQPGAWPARSGVERPAGPRGRVRVPRSGVPGSRGLCGPRLLKLVAVHPVPVEAVRDDPGRGRQVDEPSVVEEARDHDQEKPASYQGYPLVPSPAASGGPAPSTAIPAIRRAPTDIHKLCCLPGSRPGVLTSVHL